MKFRPTYSLIAAVIGCFSAAQGASHLQVDFSTAAGSQTGWETIGGTGSPSGTFSGYTSLASGDITVTGAGIAFDRKAGNNAEPAYDFPGTDLDAMYGDLLFRNDNTDTVDFTIGGLLAGTYTITTHHLLSSPDPGQFDLRVQDADSGSFGQFVGNFTIGDGNASTFNPTIISFEVESNGTDDIILQMTETVASSGGNTNGWFGMNGMEVEVVPEPSSLSLLGLGGLLLLRRRR